MPRGRSRNSIDDRNRMIVPAKSRDEFAGRCVMTKGYDTCIYIYPLPKWEVFEAKLAALPDTNPDARKLKRRFTINAEDGDIDKQGRLTLPAELREFAGIKKDIMVFGVLDRLEVWAKEVWDAKGEEEESDDSYFEGMEKYGL